MSNSTGDSRSFSSSGNTGGEDEVLQNQQRSNSTRHGSANNSASLDRSNSTGSNSNSSQQQQQQQQQTIKKKRNLPGTPDPTAEVIALSPTTLMATNRFVCEICNKGFQRDQNLQLHRRGHNLPWKLKQRTSSEIRKRVYICPETTCVHHNPARALGDLTGIKKHFCRKHGEKKWKCDKCSKKYAVQSDWKAHSKTCGTKEYKCDCGTIFSRRDSFITHRAFCDALAEENNKANQGLMPTMTDPNLESQVSELLSSMPPMSTNTNTTTTTTSIDQFINDSKNPLRSLPHHHELMPMPLKPLNNAFSNITSPTTLFGGPKTTMTSSSSSSTFADSLNDVRKLLSGSSSAQMSATALLQKAAQMGATASSNINSPMMQKSFVSGMTGPMTSSATYTPRMQHNGGGSSFDHHHHHHHHQLQEQEQSQLEGIDGVVGSGGFMNQFFNKSSVSTQQEGSQFFDGTMAENSPVDGMGFFSGMFMGGGEGQHGYLKSMELENSSSSSNTTTPNMLQGRYNVSPGSGTPVSGRNPAGPSRFGGGSGDMMTVDFLGVGGSRPTSFHEQQQQQQHGLEFEGIGDHAQGLQFPYHQEEIMNGQAAAAAAASMEKPISWDE
ncbi:hypothetical protein Syun_028858 [Stephania yunnanensis]|uniref:C2H2-type domain-containing protein n=1 Tax=Stephania yunnanensis TaxID=152371 RepID=A0AAP0E4J3_9MAGN